MMKKKGSSAAEEQALLSTEIVNRGVEASGPDAGSLTFSVRVRRRLPDLLQTVNLKYVKLGYHYLINHAIYLATIPLLVVVFGAEVGSLRREELWRKLWTWDLYDDTATANYDLANVLAFFAVSIFTLSIFCLSRPRPIYLIDFACYRPSDDLKVSKEEFMERARKSGKFDEASLEFQRRILESSGLGDETYMPKSVMSASGEKCATIKEGRAEAMTVIFGALDELFDKCRVRPKDVGILVVNCSMFNPTPSLSAMIVNHYKMRGNVLSFNLGGMGCSAGVVGLDLARDMLQANPNNLAIVVSTEMVTFNFYEGRNRSMLIPNCFFRMGCSAVLLSNRRRDFRRAKYRLEHIVRTHKGSDDRSFRCVYQEEDEQRIKGLAISKDLMQVGAHALKANITTLGPLVLPLSEQLAFFASLLWGYLYRDSKSKSTCDASKSVNSNSNSNSKPYIPDYKLAFDHLCVHAASKQVLDELQRNLELSDDNMEASRMTLHRFGNTSSSSIWYQLAYLEAKHHVHPGHRVWQLAFGSGFKCNSAVWRALRHTATSSPTSSTGTTTTTTPNHSNPWLDSIHRYPMQLL